MLRSGGDLNSRLIAVALAAGMGLGFPALADQLPEGELQSGPGDSLSRLSLEDLAMIEVVSVSRRAEILADAAAAIFVITRDDIRRSGAVSLPEVLRLAPNLNVQRVNSVDYAVTARGFNGYETSNKLLVLVDGRSLYSTLSSGVFWDAQQIPLDNIDRIEVISGPGGALYGSNAMNGVINIITLPAAEATGGLAQMTIGPDERTVAVRFGRSLGASAAWRAYVTAFRAEESERPEGGAATDPADGVRGGVRMDGQAGKIAWMVQGEAFDNGLTVNEGYGGEPTSASGGHVLGRMTRPLGRGDLQLQAYYDLFERKEPTSLEQGRTTDINLQHATDWGRHKWVIGAGYRSVKSTFTTSSEAFLDPPERTLTLANLYLQDQIALRPNLTLTLGVKYEDNSFSGDQLLPSGRLAWVSGQGDLVWGAVSRASRTPNRIERDLTMPGFLVGADFQSENLTAYELGYRSHSAGGFAYSLSAFYNVYDDLRTVSLDPSTILPLRLTNHGAGRTYGIEAWGSYDVTPSWRISAGLSTLEKDFDTPEPTLDISGLVSTGDDPAWQASLRSQSRLTDSIDLDLTLRAVDDLAAVDGFVEGDVRLGWRLTDNLELSITGENLFHDRRIETGDPGRARAFGRSGRLGLRALF